MGADDPVEVLIRMPWDEQKLNWDENHIWGMKMGLDKIPVLFSMKQFMQRFYNPE